MRLRWWLLAVVVLSLRVARPSPPDAAPGWAERLELERAIAASDPSHRPHMEDGVPEVAGARFDGGAQVGAIAIGLAVIGRDGAMREVAAESKARIAGPEVRFARAPGVVEWWRSLPSGLEQGVTIARRAAGEGPLVLEMTTGAGVRAERESDDALVLRSEAGEVLARYAHLVVLDAEHTRAPARLAAHEGRIRIEVDDERARYPLVVDPLLYGFEEAVLTTPAAMVVIDDDLGWSVAISADGSTALVGAYRADGATGNEVGSVRAYVRSGPSWTEEATLAGSSLEGSARFGWSVALSADGNIGLVGAPQDQVGSVSAAGSARVFVRTGSAWTETATLSGASPDVGRWLGFSVALSGDGTIALVGAPFDDTTAGTDRGSARVFTGSGASWNEQTMLVHPAPQTDEFGAAVALAADGSRAIVGAPAHDQPARTEAGSAVVFTSLGWTADATLSHSSPVALDHFGGAVALSEDGTLALVGAPDDDNGALANAGSVRVFAYDGLSWPEGEMIVPAGPTASDWFGFSIALTGDGSRALIGMYGEDPVAGVEAGGARIFERSGSTWTEAGALLPSSPAGGDHFGRAVALSSDGTVAVVGAPDDDVAGIRNAGSARAFAIGAAAVDGSICLTGPECLSGQCVDGFCCDSACGGGAVDCQACAAALTGGSNGTCAPLSDARAPEVVCRTATLPCDVEEVCTSASTTCPMDGFAGTSVVCRPGVSACDAPEMCSGTGAVCPADGAALPDGSVCRPSQGACDPDELCEGLVCPPDIRLPAGVNCGGTVAGSCSTPGMCNGTSPDCIGGSPLGSGTLCRPRDPANPCDEDDRCDGVSDECPLVYAPSSTVCGPAPSDVCDAPDHCTGTSGDCMPLFLSGVECRAANGACDAPELCLGDSASCPADSVESAGMSCRASVDTGCDPEEACDGIAASCPLDVNTCAERDAGLREDAGMAGADAGPPVVISGCSCRAIAPSREVPWFALILACAIALYRRRRGA